MDQVEALAGWGHKKRLDLLFCMQHGCCRGYWTPERGRQGVVGLMGGLANEPCPGRPNGRGAGRAARMVPGRRKMKCRCLPGC